MYQKWPYDLILQNEFNGVDESDALTRGLPVSPVTAEKVDIMIMFRYYSIFSNLNVEIVNVMLLISFYFYFYHL